MNKLHFIGALIILLIIHACADNKEKKDCCKTKNDSTTILQESADSVNATNQLNTTSDTIEINKKATNKSTKSIIYIYNFHSTNRCPSCIAIENGTTKTLNTNFKKEVKEGRIVRKIINVDDDVNAKIAEKYQAFGSGLFITQNCKGKETTTDMTGDGFKFAKNKEDLFIEKLTTTIKQYLN